MHELERPEEDQFDELVHGDHPPDLENMPGVIQIDNISVPRGLRGRARMFLRQHQEDILKEARARRQDLVARVTEHGREIVIGVGVAGVIAGVVFLKYTQHRRRHPRSKL